MFWEAYGEKKRCTMLLPERPEKVEDLLSEELEGLDEVVFVRPEDGASFSLNPTAAAILDLCNGQRSHDDLIAILHDTVHADVEQAKTDLEAILTEFAEYGLIYVDNAAGTQS